MSINTTTDKTQVELPVNTVPSFTDWRSSHTGELTEVEEREAREQTLQTGNVTMIRPEDATGGKYAFYQRLDDHNRDCHWKYRDDVDVAKDCDIQWKRHVLLAIAGQVELTRFQTRIALGRLFRLDLHAFGMRTDVVAFCICGLVLRDEAERYGDDSPYHPARNPENNPPYFATVESQLIEVKGRTTKNYIQKVWAKLSQGNPPTQTDENWSSFVKLADVCEHPSYSPNWAGKESEHHEWTKVQQDHSEQIEEVDAPVPTPYINPCIV